MRTDDSQKTIKNNHIARHITGHDKLIIGVTGEICAGKDTLARSVANSLEKEKIRVSVVRTSDVLREIFVNIGIEPRRIDFHNITEFLWLHFGEDILAKVMKHRIHEQVSDVVFWVGLRSLYDLQVLSEFPNSELVFVEATTKERFDRITKRNENCDDQGKTWEAFLQDCEQSTERTIRSFRTRAQLIINNADDHLIESKQSLLLEIKRNLDSSLI